MTTTTQAAHTKGPWKHTGNNQSLNNYGDMVHSKSESHPVVTVNRGPNAVANATLIASAPQMREALEGFMKCQAPDGTKCAPNDSDFERGRIALAKTEVGS